MTVDVVTTGFVRLVTINRPEQRNAVNRETYRGIGEAFASVEHDDAVLVVLTGAGDQAFCAGMDLKAFASGDRITADDGPGPSVCRACLPEAGHRRGERRRRRRRLRHHVGLRPRGRRRPRHVRVARGEAGLVGVGATQPGRTPAPAVTLPSRLALTGELMDASPCVLHHGLVNRVVPGAEVVPTAVGLAEKIAANAPLAVALAKEIAFDAALAAGRRHRNVPRQGRRRVRQRGRARRLLRLKRCFASCAKIQRSLSERLALFIASPRHICTFTKMRPEHTSM